MKAAPRSTTMRPAFTVLVNAFLRPTSVSCLCQIRASSTGHNVTLLDKLHRRQKQAVRQQLAASSERARTDPRLNFTLPKAASVATQPPPTPPSSSSSSSGSIIAPSTPPDLPYTIIRTRPGSQLPVYNVTKSGGSKRLTRLRKVSGDLNALKTDLTKALGMEGGIINRRGEKVEGVTVNWLTKHVIVRGWRGAEVRAWAESSGF